MTSTPFTKPPAPPNTFPVDAPQWLYQEIMRHIEPDLMLGRVEDLDRVYAGETEKEKEERMRCYEEAFALFDRVYADVSTVVGSQARALNRRARGQALAAEGRERGQELDRIESLLNTHSSHS